MVGCCFIERPQGTTSQAAALWIEQPGRLAPGHGDWRNSSAFPSSVHTDSGHKRVQDQPGEPPPPFRFFPAGGVLRVIRAPTKRYTRTFSERFRYRFLFPAKVAWLLGFGGNRNRNRPRPIMRSAPNTPDRDAGPLADLPRRLNGVNSVLARQIVGVGLKVTGHINPGMGALFVLGVFLVVPTETKSQRNHKLRHLQQKVRFRPWHHLSFSGGAKIT